MAAKKKRFETFAERDRKKFVSESFGNIFVTACFLCLTQPLFNFYRASAPARLSLFRGLGLRFCGSYGDL